MNRTTAEFLSKTHYFAHASRTEIEAFLPNFESLSLSEGETLFSEGDEDSAWYLITKGSVSILRSGADGGAHILAELGQGEAFGEMSLLEKRPRMGTAMTLQSTELLRLRGETFENLLKNDSIAVGILRAMAIAQSRRLREMTFILQDLTEADMVQNVLPNVGPLDVNAVIRAGLLFN
ncbi:MAG: cyclic nucleotide-binding domain-containing protein [Myxococcota bacterium]|nr:cyclic nucleotide-binding domain-containing protein [Myxococcota bacterium]